MRFYKATAFLFPHSYERRILLICFGAALIPLVSSIALQTTSGEWHVTTVVTLLLATLAGTGLCLATIHALLTPITDAAAMLGTIQKGQRVAQIPTGGDDLVGSLLRSVMTAADESTARVERTIGPNERDPLTGIRNHRGFLDSAETVLRGEYNAVLALIDIDYFELVNEQFGRNAGDDLLKAFARRISRGVRRSDIVARWDGDQFAILLPDTILDEARTVMERLRAAVALDEALGEQRWPVTFSCGLAPIRDFMQFGEAAHQADTALTRAKSGSKNHRVLALVD